MRTEKEIREKIVAVNALELPKNKTDRFYAIKLNYAVIKALKWVLEEK